MLNYLNWDGPDVSSVSKWLASHGGRLSIMQYVHVFTIVGCDVHPGRFELQVCLAPLFSAF